MTITYGACGHPLRIDHATSYDLNTRKPCRVCWLIEVRKYEPQGYAHRVEWAGREAEANAWTYDGHAYPLPMRTDEDARFAEMSTRSRVKEEHRRSEQALAERTMSACCEHIGHTRLEVDATIARIYPQRIVVQTTDGSFIATLPPGSIVTDASIEHGFVHMEWQEPGADGEWARYMADHRPTGRFDR